MTKRGAVTAGLRSLETMAQHVIDTDEVPGLSIAVVHEDEVVYLNGFGVRTAGGSGARVRLHPSTQRGAF